MNKQDFTDAIASIRKIENLLTAATNILDSIPPEIQRAIFDHHNETATVQHCLRWGLQAVKEIREDWHILVAELPCGGDEK